MGSFIFGQLNLNFAKWFQFAITFYYDTQTSVYNGASWTDARAEIRRLLATDFKRYGTISDAFGNCFIVNGSRIKSVTYSENTFQMLIVFKDDSTLLVRCVTDEIGSQNFRYVKFLKSSNDLANVRKNRNIKVIAQNAIQSDFIFPTFASLNDNLNEGDYVIVNPGTYTMTDSFTFKNGVDIEMKEDVGINVNYTAGDTTENGIFTDGVDVYNPDLSTNPQKKIISRIFGEANVQINNAPANRFTPVMFSYYDSELYCQFNSWESDNGYPTIFYNSNGATTGRIKIIINAEQLLDNDLYSQAMDLDSLNITCQGSFFPGIDPNTVDSLMIIRNANIVSSGNSGLESNAQARMNYHLINVYDTGAVTYDEDTHSQTGSNFYMHNVKINCDVLSAGTQISSWYNNGFNNYTNNLIGTETWSFYEDSLTLE